MSIKVFVIRADNLEEIVDRVSIVANDVLQNKSNQSILVKPNCVGAYKPERGVTTNPDLVYSICSKLSVQGHNITMGDCHGGSPGTVNYIFTKAEFIPKSAKWFKNIGIDAKETELKCRPSGKVSLCTTALESDLVISVAKFKASCYMILSGAVKNLYGMIPGTQKAKIHEEFPGRDDFANMLIELSKKPKRTMAIIDGSIVMEGNGPVHGKLRKENIYIISESIYAADFIVAQMMGLKPEQIPTVKKSIKDGLLNPEMITLVADEGDILLKDFIVPVTLSSYMAGQDDKVDECVRKIASIKVIFDYEKCIKCEQCKEHCPVNAITMTPKPVINEKLCIHCFCCNELCPVGAANVESSIQDVWDNVMSSEA